MGQRSQIYVRYPKGSEKTSEKKGLIANYYFCVYAERLVSRARYAIEHITDYFLKKNYNVYLYPEKVKQLSRVCDKNFDMRDVQISCNIIEEWMEQYPEEDFNEAVFLYQHNNDGKLFIDIQADVIKYAFTDRDLKSIMTAEEYVLWDYDDADWKKNHLEKGYLTSEAIKAFEENCKAIREKAVLMTEVELKEFISYKYRED